MTKLKPFASLEHYWRRASEHSLALESMSLTRAHTPGGYGGKPGRNPSVERERKALISLLQDFERLALGQNNTGRLSLEAISEHKHWANTYLRKCTAAHNVQDWVALSVAFERLAGTSRLDHEYGRSSMLERTDEPTDGLETRTPPLPRASQDLLSKGYHSNSSDAPVQPLRQHWVLCNLRSAFNVGSLIRTANGLGVERLHFVGYTPTPEHPKVAQTAMGAEAFCKASYWRHLGDLVQAMRSGLSLVHRTDDAQAEEPLPKTFWAVERTSRSVVLGADSLLHPELQLEGSVALLFGNERFGLLSAELEFADRVVEVPMVGQKHSLNVAVCAGMVGFWLQQAHLLQHQARVQAEALKTSCASLKTSGSSLKTSGGLTPDVRKKM